MFRNKRGQVSDAVTWIVATIVIVAIMMFFVFGASLLASTKEIGKYKATIFSVAQEVDYSLYLKKSLFTYFEIEDEDDQAYVMSELERRDSNGDFTTPLIDVRKEVFARYDLSNK